MNDQDSTMRWYAVQAKPHQEEIAEFNLQRLGLQTLCPRLVQRKVVRRKFAQVVRPLFPGYLFAHFTFGEQSRAVGYARGVRKVVVFGNTPASLDEEQIAAIRGRLDNGYVTLPGSSFKPGDRVRIEQGPLSGLEAAFEREMDDHQRVVLLLRTLAYQARVVMPLEQVVNL